LAQILVRKKSKKEPPNFSTLLKVGIPEDISNP
jgi:hypothetical protein